MVNLDNKDKVIFNLPMRLVDIVAEYQTHGRVTIRTNYEGICLHTAGFYHYLDYICDLFKFDKANFEIITSNVEERHPVYKIQVEGNHWINNCKKHFLTTVEKNSKLKHVGCFLGRPSWNRLVTAAWLHNNPKALLTCHYNPNDDAHLLNSDLTEINFHAAEELLSVVNFLPKCPIVSEEGFINPMIGPEKHYIIMKQYSNIFLDIVHETYISGVSFFPTEKTFRPIIAKTPFITMAPAGYLGNLRRIGLKTFDQWWDESYDGYSNYERLKKIKLIVEDIFTWSDDRIKNTLNEMNQVLEHNYNTLRDMDPAVVKLSST